MFNPLRKMKKQNKINSGVRITSWIIVLTIVFLNISAFAYGADTDLPAEGPTGNASTQGGSNPLSTAEPTQTPSNVTMDKFDVSNYLKIEGGQTYLESDAKQKGAVGELIIKLIKLLTTTIGSFALLIVIAGGIVIMVSHGNQNMQTKGKEMIKFAILGLVVAFMSLIIVTFVQSLFYTV
jgi:hypothetical protein